jgi:hypothetical protein
MTIDGHVARPLMAHHELRPGDHYPIVKEEQDWLWIDVESLVFVRWKIRNGGVPLEYGYVFTLDPNLDMRPPQLPKGLSIPTCVQ